MLITDTSKKTQRTLELAKRVASNSTYGRLMHGAILIKGGNVVNVAFNKPDFTSFGNRFRNNYTCGDKLGEYRMSKPCPMCEEVLKFVGVKKVVYTTGQDTMGEHRL